MNPGRAPLPRRPTGLVVVAGLLAIIIGFLAGPSGLIRLAARYHHSRQLQGQIVQLKKQITDETRERNWLANPDSAKVLARRLLGPQTDTSKH